LKTEVDFRVGRNSAGGAETASYNGFWYSETGCGRLARNAHGNNAINETDTKGTNSRGRSRHARQSIDMNETTQQPIARALCTRIISSERAPGQRLVAARPAGGPGISRTLLRCS
jgi:hypothetical protein